MIVTLNWCPECQANLPYSWTHCPKDHRAVLQNFACTPIEPAAGAGDEKILIDSFGAAQWNIASLEMREYAIEGYRVGIEKIMSFLEKFERAYPLDVFPDTTQAERVEVIASHRGFIDRTSAMMGRHLVSSIRRELSESGQ